MRLSTQIWKECESRLGRIKLGRCEGRVLQEVDSVSERLCLVLDELNAKANLDLNSEARSAAREEFLVLSEHVQAINTDPEIYSRLKQDQAIMSQEGERVKSRLLMEFEWEGASLPNLESRKKVSQMQNELREKEYLAELEYQSLGQNRPKMKLVVAPGEKELEVDNSDEVFHSVMFHESNPSLRKQVYDLHFASDAALDRFAETRQGLRESRHSIANALGFPTHAHFAANRNMANDPAQVESFLRQLAGEIKPIVQAKLGNAQRMHEWEFQRQAHVQTSSAASEAKLNGFFSLEQSLRGIALLCEHLFDVRLERRTVGEFRVYNDQEFVGIIELDLAQREAKNPHPCLFPLRTSCGTNEFAPARAIVSCAFGEHVGHAGFRALMHEFGHALHTVLSKTEFQHLSGTRGEVDFIETPSSLLERMAWDKHVIAFMDQGGKYFAPGELDDLHRKRVGFAAFDLQEQVFHSLFDLNFHLHVSKPENDLYWGLKHECGPFLVPQHSANVRRELFFPHVLGSAYAGSVYSYVWGAALTCDLWDALFANDPLNPESGRRLKRELFEKGGAAAPHQVMTALVGRSQVDSRALLKDIQI
ncbi:hypothetical protein BASA81_001209 [Batrachochytrium salamandrivorans]|nr:hypothetical protein BASA81_001209 [Batrachochytrium salamandrivorans]